MTLSFNTPILFLIFNRPDTAQEVFNQIKKIKPRYLYVCADGPRVGREDDKINCKLARAIIDQVDWECEVKTLFRDENLGCGFGVCSGISWFFEQVEEGIILEDDCLPDPSFFQFCSELLTRYKEDESIYLISGTNMQNGINRGQASYYFSNYPVTWGWASWRRAWKYFVYDIPHFNRLFESGEFNHVFQNFQEKLYWRKKIKLSVIEKKNIWDYQWWFAIWKNKGITITPNTNLILNLGFRNTGSHIFLRDSIREPLIKNSIQFPLIHPNNKIIDMVADQYLYKNALSHSFFRFFRLVRENGVMTIVKYTIGKFK
jgi:hypothetical protein